MAKTIREQYLKERRRIQRFIRSATKRGYIIPENILPDIPKRVTRASVSRLKKITPERIYSKSQYVSRETGEIKTGKAGRAEERKAASRKAAETRRWIEETSRGVGMDKIFSDYCLESDCETCKYKRACGDIIRLLEHCQKENT